MMRHFLIADNLRLRLALRRERRLTARLEQQLEGERSRNQSREDALNTAYLQMMGLFGIPPRNGPALPRPTLAQQVERQHQIAHAEPFDLLTKFEQDEFRNIYWRDDGRGEAQLAGDTYESAKHKFAKYMREGTIQ